MTELAPRKLSERERRPTQRLNEYDHSQGRLTTLSKSVGRLETPPTAKSQAADWSKKQAVVAAARGNTSKPGPLKPLKRKADQSSEAEDEEKGEEDELEDDDSDNEAGPPLLDYQLDELENKIDRTEWLYQSIKKLGTRRNYRDDPGFQTEGSLRKELKRLRSDGSAPNYGAPMSASTHRVKTGLTHILQPQTLGHSSRVKLVRTDDTTIGLDGTRIQSQDHVDHGFPTSVKLPRTHMKRENTDNNTPSKRRAVVPISRIKALRIENAKTTDGATIGQGSNSSKSKPIPPKPIPRRSPSVDVEMEDRLKRTATIPKVEMEVSGAEVDATEHGENNNPVGHDQLTKRQRAQLRSFTPDVCELVQWVAEQVKLDLALVCPFPETLTQTPKDRHTYLDHWIPKYWAKANEDIREGRPAVPLQDIHSTYIRNQLPPTRNGMRKACDGLVQVYFNLRRSDLDHATRAKSLTDGGDERWLSPNRKNDDERFKHPIIRDAIESAFFRTPRSFGFKHIKRFTLLVPIPTIAYACSIIRNRIKAFETDNNSVADLNSTSDSNAYVMYMKMLEDLRKKHPGHLLEARTLITLQYIKAQPKPMQMPMPEMNFGPDRDIDMDCLEEIRDLFGEDAPDIDEWDAVQDVQKRRKGKARDQAGPSGSKN